MLVQEGESLLRSVSIEDGNSSDDSDDIVQVSSWLQRYLCHVPGSASSTTLRHLVIMISSFALCDD